MEDRVVGVAAFGPMKALRWAAVAVAVAAMATACGEEARDGAGTGADLSARAEVEGAFDSVRTAFYRGDGAGVCRGLSDRARTEIEEAAGEGVDCARVFGALRRQDLTGKPGDPRARLLRVRISGDRARGQVAIGAERSGVRFRREGGRWTVDEGLFGVSAPSGS